MPAESISDLLTADDLAQVSVPGKMAELVQWLEAGARLVCVIDPARRQAYVYRDQGDMEVVHADGYLDGQPVLAGFIAS